MATLSIETDIRKSIPVMTVRGRVDSETAPELGEALIDLIAGENPTIVLDLQGVEYLSSAGLRAIVKAGQDAQKSGGELRLVAISDAVEVVLRTVGMIQMFKIFPNNEAAATGF